MKMSQEDILRLVFFGKDKNMDVDKRLEESDKELKKVKEMMIGTVAPGHWAYVYCNHLTCFPVIVYGRYVEGGKPF